MVTLKVTRPVTGRLLRIMQTFIPKLFWFRIEWFFEKSEIERERERCMKLIDRQTDR